jgi:hypothetical protein
MTDIKRKPEVDEVRDHLITGFCQECPCHFDDECGDHNCFLWEIFGVLTEAEG